MEMVYALVGLCVEILRLPVDSSCKIPVICSSDAFKYIEPDQVQQ